MIYFDKKTIKLVRYIKRHAGVTEGKLHKKFGDISMLLISLFQEDYVIIKNENDKYVHHAQQPYHTTDKFTYYPTSKLNQLVEEKVYNFKKWIFPLAISVASLIASVLTLLYSIYGDNIIKVLLVK